MIDFTSEFGIRVNKRLLEDDVIWLTTVSPNGNPNPNPVWFFWDGKTIIVYSQPDSYRVRNIKKNPKVSLNLDGADALGNNVMIVSGEAALYPDYKKVDLGYEAKYKRYFPSISMTVEELTASYSVEIRITPIKIRG